MTVSGPSPWPHLRRLRLAPDGTVEACAIGTARFDFPTVNESLPAAVRHRFVYGVGPHPATPQAFANALFKLDIASSSQHQWSQAGHYLSEAIFVPRNAHAAEDDGVLLTVALISGEARSALLLIDAATLVEIGRARLPIHLPFGFHGRFFPRSL
jgi:carotenoid cleavage dioxygenase-like enzyme